MNTTPDETPPSAETDLLTPEQLARKLSITRRCLGNWTRDKIIPMVKVGRICRFDLQKVRAALARYEQEAVTTLR